MGLCIMGLMDLDASNMSYPVLSILLPELSQDAHFIIAGILLQHFLLLCLFPYLLFLFSTGEK